MESNCREDLLLLSWVQLSGMLKNSRITSGLSYNEATTMLLLYNRRMEDGAGLCSVREIVERSRMLKSQVNHVLNSLEKRGLIRRIPGEEDRRVVFVQCVEEKLDTFLQVHRASQALARSIIEIIGPEDADAFIRIVEKLTEAEYQI